MLSIIQQLLSVAQMYHAFFMFQPLPCLSCAWKREVLKKTVLNEQTLEYERHL